MDEADDVVHMPANNDEPAQSAANGKTKSRLWLEGYTDADAERAADSPNFWERAIYTR